MVVFNGYVLPFALPGYEGFGPVAPDDLDRLSAAFGDGLALSVRSGELEELKPSMLGRIGSALEAAAMASASALDVVAVEMTLAAVKDRGAAYVDQVAAGGE